MTCESYFLVCTFVCIISLSCISSYDVTDTSREGSTISCTCGKDTVNRSIKKESVEDALEKIIKSNLDSTSILYYPDIIRDHFLNCSLCKISIVKCRGHWASDEYSCTEQIAEFVIYKNETVIPEYIDMMRYAAKNITAYLAGYDGSPSIRIQKRNTVEYPIFVHVPIGGLNTTREKRYDDWCHFPTSLQTADLNCKIYPSKKKCLQRCAFGFTLNGVTQLQFSCRKNKNKWKPHNFVECLPYVDCTLSLTSGGKAKCTTATLDRGPICSIKCDRFEDKSKTRTKSECDINGKWSPSLPFCATPGSGIYLYPPPRESNQDTEELL